MNYFAPRGLRRVAAAKARGMPARGNAPDIVVVRLGPKGTENSPAPFQGAQRSVDIGTQGVALG